MYQTPPPSSQRDPDSLSGEGWIGYSLGYLIAVLMLASIGPSGWDRFAFYVLEQPQWTNLAVVVGWCISLGIPIGAFLLCAWGIRHRVGQHLVLTSALILLLIFALMSCGWKSFT